MGLFTMPSLGSDMESGTLAEWLVAPGDTVARGDAVAVVETQKGAIEIECFEAGTVQELKAQPGQVLPVGAPMAVIRAAGEAAPEPAAAPQPAAPAAPAPAPVAAPPAPAKAGALRASPAARLRAADLGVDLDGLTGSGPGGAIVLADVDASGGGGTGKPASRLDEMRKAIAAAMTRAKQTIPHFYLSQTMDVQDAVDLLAARNAGVPPAERILLGAVLLRAAALAAQREESLNGHYSDGAFQPAAQVNPGIAVALRGGGLVAPALEDAPSMPLAETMAAMRDLVSRARAGRLTSSEMTRGTLTVSSLGGGGVGEVMAGVIFPPQVALIGIGAPQLRPWVAGGSVVPRRVVTVTVAADHRVSGGRQAARFLSEFETLVSQPEAL
ncbi:dihydrolipoamide acetyltransferase family protein [Leisingera caerulea]|uniref:Dihydrolipoamide acetyltransferase component of pyruvate dehydrogenase complex n=1 Tax=Leisingera caerulea TaxID=506591 RepID=A0A9Q9HLE9_LEICA|nr:dihydrolipoamide acetyltransferase family protein [Leisingera caerulea]UWQ56531.1 2-oxo acid dehydrogenase subunit E2 [Leisingera caerulea]